MAASHDPAHLAQPPPPPPPPPRPAAAPVDNDDDHHHHHHSHHTHTHTNSHNHNHSHSAQNGQEEHPVAAQPLQPGSAATTLGHHGLAHVDTAGTAAGGGAAAGGAPQMTYYARSSQHTQWMYTPQSLHDARAAANARAQARLSEHGYVAAEDMDMDDPTTTPPRQPTTPHHHGHGGPVPMELSTPDVTPSTKRRMVHDSPADVSMAGATPPPAKRTRARYHAAPLTLDEENLLLQHYIMDITRYTRPFGFNIRATCATFLRRYFVHNTLMDIDPHDLFPSIIFLAIKCEADPFREAPEMNAELERMLGRPNARDAMCKHEVMLLLGLKYHLVVYHPFRALRALLAQVAALIPEDDYNIVERRTNSLALFSLTTESMLLLTPAQIALAVLDLAGCHPVVLHDFDSTADIILPPSETAAAAVRQVVDQAFARDGGPQVEAIKALITHAQDLVVRATRISLWDKAAGGGLDLRDRRKQCSNPIFVEGTQENTEHRLAVQDAQHRMKQITRQQKAAVAANAAAATAAANTSAAAALLAAGAADDAVADGDGLPDDGDMDLPMLPPPSTHQSSRLAMLSARVEEVADEDQ